MGLFRWGIERLLKKAGGAEVNISTLLAFETKSTDRLLITAIAGNIGVNQRKLRQPVRRPSQVLLSMPSLAFCTLAFPARWAG